jgi:Cu/Ag efflux protein CusF
MHMVRTLSGVAAALALAAVLAVPSGAAQQPVTKGAEVSETFTIDAIDQTTRLVTLRDSEGNVETIYCGPEVERFKALKVGDKVTFRYYESMVFQIRKPGDATPPPADTAAVARTPGDKPGGTMSKQVTARVTVEAVDPKVPSIAVKTENGHKMSFKVQDAKNLEGVKPGDRVEITYTQGLAISVS